MSRSLYDVFLGNSEYFYCCCIIKIRNCLCTLCRYSTVCHFSSISILISCSTLKLFYFMTHLRKVIQIILFHLIEFT